MLAREHLVANALDICLLDEGKEGLEDGLRDQILRVIEEEGDRWVIGGDVFLGEGVETRRVLSEEILQNKLGFLGVVDLLQLLPGIVFCERCWSLIGHWVR